MTGERQPISFSVVVVSWQRPDWLSRCLCALRQIDHPNFEIVVVADSPGLQANDTSGMKSLPFDVPNISEARNLGIVEAAGDFCAFIDDDAVPEPLWLRHHEAALAQTNASASVGYVRGRNGINFQSRVHSVDEFGETHIENDDGIEPIVPNLRNSRVLKLIGTNMVISRKALLEIGGFDSAFSYFMDDSDISRRLFHSGYVMATAPLAEVHHGFAASERRTSRRAPRDLFEIGRSSAVFLRRHIPAVPKNLPAKVADCERSRSINHMVRGTLEPSDIHRLESTLKAGWAQGVVEKLPEIKKLQHNDHEFQRYEPISPGHRVLHSRLLRRRCVFRHAKTLVNKNRVSVFSFSLTPVRHHVRYLAPGVWIQKGGQFGPSERSSAWFRWCKFEPRVTKEMTRVAKQRGLEVD